MPPRKTLFRIAKWIIAVLVVIGLAWATKSATEQWQQQTLAIEESIAGLDGAIKSESDPDQQSGLIAQRDDLIAAIPSLQNLRWNRIAVAAFLYAIGIFVPGFVLHQALRSLGENPRLQTSITAQLLGHVGKYVPGKAMVIVLRAGALAQDHVAPMRATIAVFMETLMMMAVGAVLACVVICWLPVPQWMIWTAVVTAVIASVPTLPPLLTRVAARVAKVDDGGLINDETHSRGTIRFFVLGWTFSLLSWLLIGASFSVLVTAIPHVQIVDASSAPSTTPVTTWELCAVSTAAIGLAMVVGFASLLPGGAGVRELVLTTILATTISMSHALLAAIAARLMFIVVEALWAGLAWCWLRQQSST